MTVGSGTREDARVGLNRSLTHLKVLFPPGAEPQLVRVPLDSIHRVAADPSGVVRVYTKE